MAGIWVNQLPGFDAAVNAVQAGQADAIMAGMTKQQNVKKSSPCLILTTIQSCHRDYEAFIREVEVGQCH